MADPTPTPAMATAAAEPQQPPTPTVTTYAPLTPTQATVQPLDRIPYTRHATAGKDDDLIRAKALVDFWKVMTVVGGISFLWIIVSTSYCVGHQGVQPTSVAPTTTSVPVVTQPVPAPAPAPQVVVVQVPVPPPVQQVTYPPSTLAETVTETPQIETQPLGDTQRRNKALEDRLRRKHGH